MKKWEIIFVTMRESRQERYAFNWKLKNIIFELYLRGRDTRKSHQEKHREESEKNKQLTDLTLSTIYNTNMFTIK